MAKEIERKFLVRDESFKSLAPGVLYKQGYLSTDPERTLRVRIRGEKAFLTIKGKAKGAVRLEYEYDIPLKDAEELLQKLCIRPVIEKHRYTIPIEGALWEVDEFHGDNQGLVIAEIELGSETEAFSKPPWIGQEVTEDFRYQNSNLVRHPYKDWK